MLRKIRLYLEVFGFNNLLAAVWARVTGVMAVLELKRDGIRYPFWLRTPSSDVSTYKQIFFNREYDFQVENSPSVIVDAGANIGLAAVYFANKFPTAKIVAIEPEASNFEVLLRNVASYPNIFPLQAALWGKSEKINLVDPGLGKWGFMTESIKSSPSELGDVCHAVEGITVDEVMEKFKIPRISILKIDIEGAEKEVFDNASAWIERVDSLIVELHDRMKPGCSRSFYQGTSGFDGEWTQGENVYLTRGSYLRRVS